MDDTTSALRDLSLENDPARVRTIPNDYSYYTRLDIKQRQIRLLRILPEKDDQQLSIVLHTTRLSQHPPYRALSYTWGELNDIAEIRVMHDGRPIHEGSAADRELKDGDESYNPEFNTHTLNITKNLYRALETLRRHCKDAFFWIDMLCINQGDVLERTSQMMLMKEIFSSSERVEIWLDPDADATEAWLADENIELSIFVYILKDYGFCGLGGDSPRYMWKPGISILDLVQMFEDYVCRLELEHGLDAVKSDSILQRDISDHTDRMTKRCEERVIRVEGLGDARLFIDDRFIFYDLLHRNSPAINRLIEKRSSQLYNWEDWLVNPKIQFLCWLIAPFYQHHDESVKESVMNLLVLITHPWSEVMDFLPHVGSTKSQRHVDRVPATIRIEKMFHPWFTRVWVLQEVISRPKSFVRFGVESIHMRIFTTLVELEFDRCYAAVRADTTDFDQSKPSMNIVQSVPTLWIHLAPYLNGRRSIEKLDLHLLLLIESLSTLGATDPRDRLFALYHLATDLRFNTFRPDYSRSIVDVYIDFTKAVIQETESVNILFTCHQFERPTQGEWAEFLPSWVPTYQHTDYSFVDPERPRGSSRAQIRNAGDAHVLSLAGIHVATIHQAFDARLSGSIYGQYNLCKIWSSLDQAYTTLWDQDHVSYRGKYLEDYVDKHLELESLATLLLPHPEAVHMLACLWHSRDPNFEQLDHNLCQQHLLASTFAGINPSRRAELIRKAWWLLRHAAIRFGQGFAVTTGGDICSCHESTRPGDLIVLFDGADRFIVLRPQLAEGQKTDPADYLREMPKYEYIGQCHISAAMNVELARRQAFVDVSHARTTETLSAKQRPGHRATTPYTRRFWDLI